MDQEPRTVTDDEVATLQDLAAVVVDDLELRLGARKQAAVGHALLQEMLKARRCAEADRDRSEQRSRTLAERLRQMSDPDPLTGLGGRRLIEDELSVALERMAADGKPFAVLVIDVDRLGQINADQGLAAGDQFVSAVAERLRNDVRHGEVLGRVGGDRFVLVCPGVGSEQAAATVIRRLHSRLAGLRDPTGRAVDPKVGVVLADRFGICNTVSTVRPPSAEEILAAGRSAAADVGNRKGSRYRIYGRQADTYGLARPVADSELRRGLTEGQFRVAYQPIVSLASGETKGVEALVRWQHPHRGLLAPAEFLPAAEASGFIVVLGAHVISAACHHVAAWNEARLRQGRAPFELAVNCSGDQITDAAFATMIRTAIAESGLEPSQLTLEITENVLLDGVAAAAFTAEDLAGLGVRLAIDDFGTGYASLTYLRRFNPSVVKIDRSFITEVCSNKRDEAIVTAIISLAHSLDAVVVAEGIETALQVRLLKGLACEYGQGYYYAKPVIDWPNIEGDRSGSARHALPHR